MKADARAAAAVVSKQATKMGTRLPLSSWRCVRQVSRQRHTSSKALTAEQASCTWLLILSCCECDLQPAASSTTASGSICTAVEQLSAQSACIRNSAHAGSTVAGVLQQGGQCQTCCTSVSDTHTLASDHQSNRRQGQQVLGRDRCRGGRSSQVGGSGHSTAS